MLGVIFYVILWAQTSQWSMKVVRVAGILLVAAAVAYGYSVLQRRLWIQNVRLRRFADANDMIFSPAAGEPGFSGMIFGIGHSRKLTNKLQSRAGASFEIANYRYSTGRGKQRQDFDYGYIMIQLDRNLPHMVLDSRSNDTRAFGMTIASSLPVTFGKSQKLSLEGDFDSHFTLYAPTEYKRDALYVFSPDLMALFIDQSGSYDAEIVDDQLYIYSTTPFGMIEPSVMQRIFSIIDTVGAKTLTQTDRYADERVGNRVADVVAEPGQRLKSHSKWLIPAIIMLVYVLFNMLSGFVQFFTQLSQ